MAGENVSNVERINSEEEELQFQKLLTEEYKSVYTKHKKIVCEV